MDLDNTSEQNVDQKTDEVNSDSTTELIEENTPGCYFKARHVLALMGFLGMFNVYALRSNLSVAIVAMVNTTEGDEDSSNSSDDVCPDRYNQTEDSQSGEYHWDAVQQGLILGCYFYGYIVSNIPGGWLAKKIGPRLVFGISMLISSIITLVSPAAANYSFGLFVALRILLGFFQGVSFPTMHGAWGKWAPITERSSLIAFHMSGSSFGTFVTLPLAGVVATNWGWEAIFYYTGVCALVWSIVWLAIIHNSPDEHPRISEEERVYINSSINEAKKAEDVHVTVPWKAILTSVPVWAIAIAHFASNWGNYTLMTMLPTYMSTILRFNLSAAQYFGWKVHNCKPAPSNYHKPCISGALSSLPYIMQWIFTVVGGYLTDVVRNRTTVSTIAIRKGNTAMGLIIPAIFVVLAGYVGCAVVAAVACFTISVAFNALTIPGCKSNPVDIAPKYGGIIYGISNTLANVPGFLAPQVVGFILVDDDSLSQWQTVFWIAAAVYCAGAIVYLIFAKAEEQKWAAGKITQVHHIEDDDSIQKTQL